MTKPDYYCVIQIVDGEAVPVRVPYKKGITMRSPSTPRQQSNISGFQWSECPKPYQRALDDTLSLLFHDLNKCATSKEARKLLSEYVDMDNLKFASSESFNEDIFAWIFGMVSSLPEINTLNARFCAPVGTRLFCMGPDWKTVVFEVIPAIDSRPASGREILVLNGKYAGAHHYSPSVLCGLIFFDQYQGQTHRNGYDKLYFTPSAIGDGTNSEYAIWLQNSAHYAVKRVREKTEEKKMGRLLISNHFIHTAALYDDSDLKDDVYEDFRTYFALDRNDEFWLTYREFTTYSISSRILNDINSAVAQPEENMNVEQTSTPDLVEVEDATPTPDVKQQELSTESQLIILYKQAQEGLRSFELGLDTHTHDVVADPRGIREARMKLLDMQNNLYEVFGSVMIAVDFAPEVEIEG